MISIVPGYSGKDPQVSRFFFGPEGGLKGSLFPNDEIILAIDHGVAIVGGVILRGGKVIHQVGDENTKEKLFDAVKNIC